MGIFNFKQFVINEAHGLSKSSIMFSDVLEKKTYYKYLLCTIIINHYQSFIELIYQMYIFFFLMKILSNMNHLLYQL